MTRRDLTTFCLHHGVSMTPDEIDDALEAANRDPEEGADWLPYYKTALGCLAQCVGRLSEGALASDPVVRRLWELHLLFCCIGPNTDTVHSVRLRARIAAEMATFPGGESE